MNVNVNTKYSEDYKTWTLTIKGEEGIHGSVIALILTESAAKQVRTILGVDVDRKESQVITPPNELIT